MPPGRRSSDFSCRFGAALQEALPLMIRCEVRQFSTRGTGRLQRTLSDGSRSRASSWRPSRCKRGFWRRAAIRNSADRTRPSRHSLPPGGTPGSIESDAIRCNGLILIQAVCVCRGAGGGNGGSPGGARGPSDLSRKNVMGRVGNAVSWGLPALIFACQLANIAGWPMESGTLLYVAGLVFWMLIAGMNFVYLVLHGASN